MELKVINDKGEAQKSVDALMKLDLPAGVDVEIKL